MKDDDPNRRQIAAKLWREALVATSIGWEVALPIFGGVLIGQFLDRYLGTTYIFTIGLLVMGIVSGYYNILRWIRKSEAESRRKRLEQEQLDEKDRPARGGQEPWEDDPW
ncbi:MAG: AtpZ/AtpI family protein [Anaerolineaceae bacterium]|nr:AtpZ/AtpI family protein [Anaerolineaceae bacterium]